MKYSYILAGFVIVASSMAHAQSAKVECTLRLDAIDGISKVEKLSAEVQGALENPRIQQTVGLGDKIFVVFVSVNRVSKAVSMYVLRGAGAQESSGYRYVIVNGAYSPNNPEVFLYGAADHPGADGKGRVSISCAVTEKN